MIGKRLKIIITILAFLLSISIANAVTYIKISVRDCLTCTLNFDRVIKNTTNYLVVLDDSYVDEYQNVDGVPTATGKSYPTSSFVQGLADYVHGLQITSFL